MKKQALILSSLMGLITTHSHAQSMSEHEGTLTITPSFVSAYMFRGFRLGGFSFQPIVEYSKGPLSLDLFTNFPIADKILGSSDPEIDFSVSYAWNIVPNLFTIKPGVWLYTYPRADKDKGFYKVTCEPYLSFDYTLNDMVFSLNFYYDFTLKGGGYEFGFNYSIPIKSIELDIELSALIGRYDLSDSTNEPTKVKNKGDYFQAGVSIPYEFSSKSKLSVSWYYTKGTNNYFYYQSGIKESNPDAIGRGVFQLSFSQSF
jgi:hypothetical protein